MRHVLVIVVDIPAMLAPQVTIIRYFDIPAMLAPPKYCVSNTPHPIYY